MYSLPVLRVRDQNGGVRRMGSSWGLRGGSVEAYSPCIFTSSSALCVCPVSTVCKHLSYWVRTDANDFTIT